jgi:exodeoxyribonuclease-5
LSEPRLHRPAEVTLSQEQTDALSAISKWTDQVDKPYFTLGGYAGSGKSTLVRHLIDRLPSLGYNAPALCTLSGKAASVLRQKGNARACTIHSIFYFSVKTNGGMRFFPRTRNQIREVCDFIIIDEASMISSQIHRQLLSAELPVLYIGDHGQLPPIGDDPGLMQKLDVELKTIHRQALDSPIIQYAHAVRKGKYPQLPGINYSSFRDPTWLAAPFARNPHLQCIVSLNTQRVRINSAIRSALKFAEPLVPGERIMSLRNNYDLGLFNGDIHTVLSIADRPGAQVLPVTLKTPLGDQVTCSLSIPSLSMEKLPNEWDRDTQGEPFHYAYAITAHKAQGSEWGEVLVAEQPCRAWSRERWLYTAVTRAKESLTHVQH